MIAIVDYGAGNIFSVKNALDYLGLDCKLTSDKDEIKAADAVILPGVGAFPAAMAMLEKSGLIDTIKEEAAKKPLLGICLGMQMLFDKSYEDGDWEGLGFIPGEVVRFGKDSDPSWNEENKIPHMGWNSIHFQNNGRLFANLPQDSYDYFVHSYYLQAEDESIVKATTDYSTCIHASVEKDNVFACQFHPEKSSDVGLTILKNFCEI